MLVGDGWVVVVVVVGVGVVVQRVDGGGEQHAIQEIYTARCVVVEYGNVAGEAMMMLVVAVG